MTSYRRAIVGEIGGGANANCYSQLQELLDYLSANNEYIGWTGWAAGPRKHNFASDSPKFLDRLFRFQSGERSARAVEMTPAILSRAPRPATAHFLGALNQARPAHNTNRWLRR